MNIRVESWLTTKTLHSKQQDKAQSNKLSYWLHVTIILVKKPANSNIKAAYIFL